MELKFIKCGKMYGLRSQKNQIIIEEGGQDGTNKSEDKDISD